MQAHTHAQTHKDYKCDFQLEAFNWLNRVQNKGKLFLSQNLKSVLHSRFESRDESGRLIHPQNKTACHNAIGIKGAKRNRTDVKNEVDYCFSVFFFTFIIQVGLIEIKHPFYKRPGQDGSSIQYDTIIRTNKTP